MPPDLFPEVGQQPPPAKQASPRSLPARTGAFWSPRPVGCGGCDPRVADLRATIARLAASDDTDGLLWALAVATGWLNREQAGRLAAVLDVMLGELDTRRAA